MTASAPRFRHGLVLGKFYPFHAGHAHLVRTALAQCERVTVEVLGASVESLSIDERVDWVRQEHPSARVVGGLDDAPIDFDSADAWDAHMIPIEALLDAPVDAVFTGDPYGVELARRLGATWVQVDRSIVPESGRGIRDDLAAAWPRLPAGTRAGLVARVVVLGAESTGTTTLAEDLAAALGAASVPEYGREYSEIRAGGLTAPWRDDEFDLVVDRQLELEREASLRAPTPLLVCDTDVLATALWFRRYRRAESPAILERALRHPPALYLLTGDEIPFVQDGMRDGEHVRHDMQQWFRDALAAQPVPWVELRGSREERVAAAIPLIDHAVSTAHRFAEPLEARGETRG